VELAEAVDRAVGKEETEKPDGRGRPLAHISHRGYCAGLSSLA